MSSLVKHLAPVAALTLATIGTTWFFSSQGPRHTQLTTSASPTTLTKANRAPASATAQAARPSTLELRYQPKAGRRYVYSFQRRITLQGLPQNGASSSEMTYHGQFELDVISSNSAGFEALIRAYIAEHRTKEPLTLKIKLSSAGDHLEVFGSTLHNQTNSQESAILKDLLSLWGFNLREDTVGTFDARFEADPFKKTKLSYIESKGQTSPLPEIVESEHFLGWDAYRALPHEISGHEKTRMGQASASSNMSSISANAEYQILLVQEQELGAQVAKLASQLNESETLALNVKSQESDTTEDWSTLRSELLGINALDPNAQLKIFGNLARFIKLHSDAVGDLMDLLRAQGAIQLGVNSALFKAALGALITAGTPEAQAAALKIYSDPSCPVSGKGAILSAFTTTQAPLSSATQDFLASAMKNESNPDLSQGASYALGSSIQKATDDSQKGDAIEALRQRYLSSNGNVSDQLSALDAIGNSGQAAYLPDLRSIIQSADAESVLKAKAVFALRFIRSNEATDLLAQSLGSVDSQIRQAAARAISMASWNDSFRAPLQSCASSDSVSSVQALCRSVLSASDPKLASN